jgi:uncharacterized protein YbjQ (UPF0145 family)
MSGSTTSDPAGDPDAGAVAEGLLPDVPVIRDSEKYVGGPFPLGDGLPRTIGWQWPVSGEPIFVTISRGMMGGLKILERFPLTTDGWAQVWRSLVQNDPASARKVMAVLAERETVASGRQKAAEHDMLPPLIVTTNDVPGYRITQVHGDVFGLTVRARNYFSNLGAQFRTLAGGEVVGYTKLLTDSRNEARWRMWRAARAQGANAIVAMRFDCNEIGDIMSEIAAYGTAVTVEPIPPATHGQPA